MLWDTPDTLPPANDDHPCPQIKLQAKDGQVIMHWQENDHAYLIDVSNQVLLYTALFSSIFGLTIGLVVGMML